MKLHRLRLTNYRGIDEAEVEFALTGLTIVEGPNEVGKTSLSESIRLLFDFHDSSKHNNVKATKPVTQDVGTEIELEATSGSYVFTYFKRFHKKPATTLNITSPKPENYTGREAHERAEEILRETVDMDLWRALCIEQGLAVQQADLSNQTSLSLALDIAAGGNVADPKEESLFDRVQKEYLQYYTEGGSEKKELKEAIKAHQKAEDEVAELSKQIKSLEDDIELAAELSTELENLKKQEQELRADVTKYTKSLEEIKDLEIALERANLQLESAEKSEQAKKKEMKERNEQIELVTKLKIDHNDLQTSSQTKIKSLKLAEENLEKAKFRADEANTKRREAESLLTLRRADFDYYNDNLFLEQLKERKERIDISFKEAAVAAELLEKNRIDEDALKIIQEADRSVILAQAKLETGAPNILMKGLSNLDFEIDEERTQIAKDEERSLSISDRLSISIPGFIYMEISAGSSSSDLSEQVTKMKENLDSLCHEYGVNDVDEASRYFAEAREASRTIKRQKEIEKDNLRDLSYDELERKILRLSERVPSYLMNRSKEPALSKNLEDAKIEMGNAEKVLEDAKKSWEETATLLDETRMVFEEFREQHQNVKVALDLKAKDLKEAEDGLKRSRELISDDELESEHKNSIELAKKEREKVTLAKAELKKKDPDRTIALAETAQGSLDTVFKKREERQEKNTEVQTRLKVFGEEGLHEKLDAAQSHLDHITQENTAMMRRADAARLLYSTMKGERDRVRRAYVAPLKKKIESLGHLVFDDSFEVELNDDLLVTSRSLGDVNVPFDSLSGGTQEQISLLSRLACAMTVSDNGGGSLILDDALGYTDPERLKLMGAVLAQAAKECQIIILTCVPDRYSHVGDATVVRLD